MIARPWMLLVCAAAAMTVPGLEPLIAQPSAPPPTPARPAVQLSMDEVQMLIARMRQCWTPPVALTKKPGLVVMLRINFKPDGSLAGAPVVVNASQDPLFATAAQSAIRAVTKCAPYSFLPAAKYKAWNEIEAAFDSRELAPSDKTR